MIALDTNVLVRLLVGDDQHKFRLADALFENLAPNESCFISREVLIELVWVLERTYGFKREEISQSLYDLIDSREIVAEDDARLRDVISDYASSSIEFSDLMIRSIAIERGATYVATFDQKFTKFDNVVLLE